ncbi:MAG: ATP-binding protein [Thermoanaerobaculia bacterium]
MTRKTTEARDAAPSAPVPPGPPPAAFRDGKECLDAWFAALGPMSGNPSTTHAALFQPVAERMPALRLLAERTRLTRAAGVRPGFLDAFDALGLDLLDRLLVLALLREAADVRTGRGLNLGQLCDAVGAADWSHQDAVRQRLEVAGALRRLRVVQSDADNVVPERCYRLDPRWRTSLLAGRTEPGEESLPEAASAASRLQLMLHRAGRLLALVGPLPTERLQAWSDARPDAPGWDSLSPARRDLSLALSWHLAPGRAGSSDPLAVALREAGATTAAEAALLATLLSRSPDDEPVAWALLSEALEGLPGLGTNPAALAGPESPLGSAGLVEGAAGDGDVRLRASRAARSRVVPSGLALVRPREGEPAPKAEGDDGVEKVTPRLTLSGLVLSPDARLRLAEALAVPRALAAAAEWGASESLLGSAGVALLLYGPPGTGKTLAAEAIAGELGRTLWRLRTDQILGKYVGESEKKLSAAFRAARAAGDVVLVDEADSLLSSRSADRQRWEISLTNLLLQEIERFPGVVVLTTNRDAALDPALERRLLARLEIGMPGPEERTQLWKRHLPPRAPLAGDVDLASLARAYPLSGSHIRTAALFAVAKAASRPEGHRLLTRADLCEAAGAQLARSSETKPAVGFRPASVPAPRLALVAAQHGDAKE